MTADNSSGLIVVGDDGSHHADVAWLWVSNHDWHGWRAEVVTATEPTFPPPDWDHVSDVTEWESPHERRLFSESGLSSVRHLTAAADPRLLLGGRADADLLVVGASGVGHVRAVLVGSTAEWLMHHPPAPLVVAHSAGPVVRALVCVDGSPHAQAAVDALARFPWIGSVEVELLSVDDGRAAPGPALDAASAALSGAGVRTTQQTIEGEPTHVILDQVTAVQPQLLVLGTRGLTGWKRVRLGSTAAAVARAARCSTLLACEPED